MQKAETKGRLGVKGKKIKQGPCPGLQISPLQVWGVMERMFLDDKTSVLPLARKEAGLLGGSLPSSSLHKHISEGFSTRRGATHPAGLLGGGGPILQGGPTYLRNGTWFLDTAVSQIRSLSSHEHMENMLSGMFASLGGKF